MLRKIRITLATVMLSGLTLFFLDFTGTLHHLVGWMPRLQALEAVMATNVGVIAGLLVLTLLLGRIYCSIICPLGVMQDVFGWLGKKSKKRRYGYSREMKWLRYPVLLLFIVAVVTGVGTLVQLLAPYSAYGRIVTNIFQPLWMMANNALADVAEHYDSYAFYHTDVWMRALPSLVIAVVSLIVLAILAWRGGRTYCNTICPVGTALSLVSRYSAMKIRIDPEKCRECSLCTKSCKAACIDYKNHTVDYSRCVVCGDCIDVCRHDALHYDNAFFMKRGTGTGSKVAGTDKSKRSFLMSAVMLATAGLAQEAKKTDGGLAEIEDKKAPRRNTQLTPPGSRSARNLATKCTGCQLCISECPNEVLRPSGDFMHLMQPTMSYERGYCRPECNRCSQVCPAGAILPLEKEEKVSTQIGHAVWVKENCVVLTDGVRCGNCARHCPAGAIEMVPSISGDDTSLKVPAVNEERCIGCGACEYLCPARPFSAIYVEGHEVHKEV